MKNFPLLAIVVVLYNVLAFISGGMLTSILFSGTLISGAKITFTVNELLLSLAVILLYVEILKSTRSSGASVVDHMLSMGVFVICLVEFIIFAPLGTSSFFILMLITLLDVVAGFTVTISSARRDVAMDEGVNFRAG